MRGSQIECDVDLQATKTIKTSCIRSEYHHRKCYYPLAYDS